ncbi:MAG: hypothetical protein HC767_02290 [Akkermansiaceae bacterium]|nr:hypothetical protein [Akkermansiaceae bacterium]
MERKDAQMCWLSIDMPGVVQCGVARAATFATVQESVVYCWLIHGHGRMLTLWEGVERVIAKVWSNDVIPAECVDINRWKKGIETCNSAVIRMIHHCSSRKAFPRRAQITLWA